jgi:hypothetical protein
MAKPYSPPSITGEYTHGDSILRFTIIVPQNGIPTIEINTVDGSADLSPENIGAVADGFADYEPRKLRTVADLLQEAGTALVVQQQRLKQIRQVIRALQKLDKAGPMFLTWNGEILQQYDDKWD